MWVVKSMEEVIMSGDTIAILIFSVFMGLLILIYSVPVIRILQSKFGSTKTVQAVVANKYRSKPFSKYAGAGKSEKYVIVFSVDGKKKYFQVSQSSYEGYQVNETGTLIYKGNRIVKFE